MAKTFALIGKDISHSRSPEVYENLLDEPVDYHLLDFSSEAKIPKLKDLLAKYPRISATAPFKRHVFENCDRADEVAARLGAVNAVKLADGKVWGTNTDALAFADIFRERFKDRVSNVAVLGDGSMSILAQDFLASSGIKFHVLSRKRSNLSALGEYVSSFADDSLLIVNACSRSYELGFQSGKSAIIWDMNYQMPRHKSFAELNGHSYFDGEELLIRQAGYALSFWNL